MKGKVRRVLSQHNSSSTAAAGGGGTGKLLREGQGGGRDVQPSIEELQPFLKGCKLSVVIFKFSRVFTFMESLQHVAQPC